MKRHLLIRGWKFLGSSLAFLLAFAVVVMILPSKARSQLGLDPCCAIIQVGLSSISSLLSSVVGKPLSTIQQLEQQSADFEQQVVFPLAAINQARSMAVQSQSQFAKMRVVFQLPVSSATLPTPQQLEKILLSRNPGTVQQIGGNYTALYGQVMPATDAPQPVRDLVDATDAEAQAAMKKAVEIDALADLELQAAEQINQQLQTAAPGSAAILEAQTSAWLVRANAYTQSALAELVRLRSIELANQGAQVKFSSAHTSTLHSTGGQVLQQGVH
ncbi:MAG: hypothetical protein ACRD20_07805 [Terriglobales bacterium]